MKILRFTATAGVCLLSVVMTAQVGGSAAAGASTSGNGASQQVQTNGSAGASSQTGLANARGAGGATTSAQVPAELVTKLDSKSAKAGDAVIAKTTKTVKTADGTVIKKGSKLIGTVSQTQAYSKGQAEGMLAISFDRVQMAEGEEMQMTSSIESIAPPVTVSSDLTGDEMGNQMMSAGPVSSGGSTGTGGGLGGAVGGAAGTVGGAASTVGRTGNELDAMAQNTGSQAVGVTRGAGGQVNGVASGTTRQGADVAAHASSLPGVMLSGSATGTTSSVLSASNRNVHLDSGTQMVLNVAAQR